MQILEFTKENSEKFEFQQHENGWELVIQNKDNLVGVLELCVDVLQKAGARKPYTDNFYTEKFSEEEVGFLNKYFSLNGFSMKHRDTELEEKLKQALVIITKNNPQDISELVSEMTYHDQLLMADKIAKA